MPIGLTRTSPDGCIYEANPAAVRALGYASTDALLGTNAAALYVNAQDRERFKALAERSDSIERFETQLKRVDGQPIWVHYNSRIVRDEAGRVDHYESSLEDVTELIRDRDRLKGRSRRLLAQAQALTAISSSDSLLAGDVEKLAREITEQVSLTCAAPRVNVWLFSPDESELRCIDHFDAAAGTHSDGMVLGEPQFEKEFQALKRCPYVAAEDALTDPSTSGYADGYLRLNRITSMLDSVIEFSGRHLGLLCIEHVDQPHAWEEDEITFAGQVSAKIALALSREGTRRAEQELQESRQRLDGIVGSAMDAIVTADEDHRIVLVNPAAERMFGYAPAELLGQSLDLLVPPRFRDAHSAQVAQFGRDGVTNRRLAESRPLTGLRRSGEEFPIEASISTDRSTGHRFYTAILRDVTERRQAEEALRASLKEKEALLKEVHHRVKNNMQVISSLLNLESNRIDHHGTRTVLKDMQNRILSMAVLHETLYRSHSFAEVDMTEYLSKLANQLTRSLLSGRGGITLQLDLAALSLELDQAIPCGLILNELVSNALKHAFPASRSGGVWIDLRPVSEGNWRLRVRDDGVGLPTDFETRRGRSLGLQVVADLARQLQGSLTIGPGSMFDVTFTPVPTAVAS